MIQGVIRNPLASPEIIGITAGAGLASAVLLLGMPNVSVQLLPIVSFLGGLIAAVLVYVLAFKRGISPARLALVGIAVSAVFTSGIDYLMTSFPVQLDMALIWLAGSLWARSWEQFMAVAPWILIMFAGCLLMAHKLDVLALGDEQAIGLGIRVERTRLLALAIAVALAGASVAVCGTIGFIGLMAPHMARRLVGGQHHILLPTAALVGTLLVLSADTLGRILSPPVEIPAGIITSIIGGPYFIYLLYRHRTW
jgi:ABC-type Fe3+-siderophore transport system permease subunit